MDYCTQQPTVDSANAQYSHIRVLSRTQIRLCARARVHTHIHIYAHIHTHTLSDDVDTDVKPDKTTCLYPLSRTLLQTDRRTISYVPAVPTARWAHRSVAAVFHRCRCRDVVSADNCYLHRWRKSEWNGVMGKTCETMI